MSNILYGKIKHGSNRNKFIDALHMRYEEFFSKYECTLKNKAIFYLSTPIAFVCAIIVVAIISILFPSMWSM